jgi:hypothetical protein
MFDKILCALSWIAWIAIFISLLVVSKENKIMNVKVIENAKE